MYLDPEDVIDNEFYRAERLRQAEKEKLKRQMECKGTVFIVRCSCGCGRVLGSERNYKRI